MQKINIPTSETAFKTYKDLLATKKNLEDLVETLDEQNNEPVSFACRNFSISDVYSATTQQAAILVQILAEKQMIYNHYKDSSFDLLLEQEAIEKIEKTFDHTDVLQALRDRNKRNDLTKQLAVTHDKIMALINSFPEVKTQYKLEQAFSTILETEEIKD